MIRVARNREDGVTLEQIAKDFGIHPMTLSNWLSEDAIDAGAKAGKTTTESAELREANKRIRLLEQENEVLRRAPAYLSQANLPEKDLPARDRARRRRDPRHDDVSGLEALPPGLLPLARPARHQRPLAEALLADAIFDAHADDPEFGYRFLADEVRAAGFDVCDRTVW